jgi:DNA invertase Pin-like site-specific DNA recombinase
MSDAQDMMNKMKDIPGFGDINGLLSKMGINPSNVDMKAMSARMEREMKKNATKERMRKKMGENSKPVRTDNDEPTPEQSNESIDDIVDWIEKSCNERVFKVDGGAERSTRSDKPKKKKKKKNK